MCCAFCLSERIFSLDSAVFCLIFNSLILLKNRILIYKVQIYLVTGSPGRLVSTIFSKFSIGWGSILISSPWKIPNCSSSFLQSVTSLLLGTDRPPRVNCSIHRPSSCSPPGRSRPGNFFCTFLWMYPTAYLNPSWEHWS